jgi:UDP-N-acetyl-2-amino-2-deoxyglucuronate dehydrogenase
MRNDAHAICEKPVVLNPWTVDALQEIERDTGKKIYNILQVRLHPSIIELKKRIENGPKDKIYDIDLTYITGRGRWYFMSWKGDVEKSGGVATNIGVHFFDMLTWIFGGVKENIIHVSEYDKTAGFLQLERARVRWLLSIDTGMLPRDVNDKGQRTYRSILIEGKEVEFSGGFADLHTRLYEKILGNDGFGIEEARKSIEIVHAIRNAKPVGLKGDYHPGLGGSKK